MRRCELPPARPPVAPRPRPSAPSSSGCRCRARAHPRSAAAGCRDGTRRQRPRRRSEEHTSELQSLAYLVCRLLLEKKKILIHDGRQATQLENEAVVMQENLVDAPHYPNELNLLRDKRALTLRLAYTR